MGFRVQPPLIEVQKNTPFENDRLDRQTSAEVLTQLVGTIVGPCVLAIDAPWGMGKTTFLNMWEALLVEQRFCVVKFNAWETDFADDPFLAVVEEMRSALQKHHKGGDGSKLHDAVLGVLQSTGPAVIKAAAASMLGPVAGALTDAALKALASKSLSQFGEAKAAIHEFHLALEQTTKALTENGLAAGPLVVIIDELDRCRPPYAVELLEVLKHLFSVDGVVFVLAVNRDQLGHSVRALYGADFNATVYLRRFIDIDFRLPDADRENFIEAQLDAIRRQLDVIHVDPETRHIDELTRNWLKIFFGKADPDLRTVQQALQRLGLMLAMLGGDYDALIRTVAFALILRTLEHDLYYQFINGGATDEDVAFALFERTGNAYRHDRAGANFEVEIIMAAAEDDIANHRNYDETNSRLLSQYRALWKEVHQNNIPPRDEHRHAETVLRFVEHEWDTRRRLGNIRKFNDSVDRLELLADSLSA